MARDPYGPAHKLDNALSDGHTKARALHLIGRTVLRPGEGIENGLQILRRHTIAGILHLNADMLILTGPLPEPNDAKPDLSALRGVLDGVGKEIDKYLVYPGLVPNQVFMPEACHLLVKFLSLGLCHRLDNGVHRGDHVVKGEPFRVQHDFSALDF